MILPVKDSYHKDDRLITLGPREFLLVCLKHMFSYWNKQSPLPRFTHLYFIVYLWLEFLYRSFLFQDEVSLADLRGSPLPPAPPTLFRAMMLMIAVHEGSVLASGDPAFSEAINDALYGIGINGNSRLVYDIHTGLEILSMPPWWDLSNVSVLWPFLFPGIGIPVINRVARPYCIYERNPYIDETVCTMYTETVEANCYIWLWFLFNSCFASWHTGIHMT